ncbi:hypothetical protein BJ322DRAFT_1109657 [Thelephora terrestris]|uniref:Uncharacterized protein n=1 Tax=Thelephora terrestris TaxID=56493 RepID=A0A9P6HCH7_9AGAM|nr:hypothetical protein BJ322DRAFT_1109657 [Thelephora terrestris]
MTTVQHGDLTLDNVTCLIQHHNLPEAIISDVRNFQQLPPSAQMVRIFLGLQEIHVFMATLPRPDERWQKNVKTYTKAVFIQAAAKDYQSNMIVSYVEVIIKHLCVRATLRPSGTSAVVYVVQNAMDERSPSSAELDVVSELASNTG